MTSFVYTRPYEDERGATARHSSSGAATSGTCPCPRVNQYLNGFETDFHWPKLRLVVEVDGFEHHKERRNFNSDRHRGLVHRANGWEVMRISADHVHDEPELILDALVPHTFGGPSSRSSL